ncbi:MAG: hypothetical protein NTU41_04995 [Chloroflexi bacterium]|nr:hypothetical protein [Chloroflexota bacterium]
MITGHAVDAVKEEMVAVVPIGTPLTVGPATITTLLLLVSEHHWYIVLLSFALNILIAWIIFMQSSWVLRVLGRGGVKAVSKVFNLFLAAIAVSMVIRGLNLLGILTTGS